MSIAAENGGGIVVVEHESQADDTFGTALAGQRKSAHIEAGKHVLVKLVQNSYL